MDLQIQDTPHILPCQVFPAITHLSVLTLYYPEAALSIDYTIDPFVAAVHRDFPVQ